MTDTTVQSAGAQPLQQRYTAVAIGLHWAIALLILGLIAFGFILDGMEYGPGSPKTALVQIHKSTGITVFLLSLARIIWRLMNPPPAEPPMPQWQKLLAAAVHIFLYVLIIAMPLTGWIMASASTAHDTRFFGTLDVSLPGFSGMSAEERKGIDEAFHTVHGNLAWFMIGFLSLHVAGALKHQLVDRDGLLARIAPGLFGRTAGPPDNGHGAIWAFGAAALVFAAIAGASMMSASQSASAGAETGAATTGNEPGRFVSNSPAPTWTVDSAQSSIKFKGAYVGRPFEGSFKTWDAAIQFDPAKPEDARIRVVIHLTDPATRASNIDAGDPYFNENVTQGDWFDVAKHPEAVFEVNQGVFKDSETAYEATGILTVKGVANPVRLKFTLEINGATAKMHGATTLQRLALGLGKDTLAAAKGDEEWVADAVAVTVDVVATKQ
jgi:cytochrome b561/polyisoprenoid-binding protein YceI